MPELEKSDFSKFYRTLTAEAGWYSGVDELIASPVFRDIMQWDS